MVKEEAKVIEVRRCSHCGCIIPTHDNKRIQTQSEFCFACAKNLGYYVPMDPDRIY